MCFRFRSLLIEGYRSFEYIQSQKLTDEICQRRPVILGYSGTQACTLWGFFFSGAPDLMEQIRLSLAELESKKPGPPESYRRDVPNAEVQIVDGGLRKAMISLRPLMNSDRFLWSSLPSVVAEVIWNAGNHERL
jgi:hypothetical protein